MENMELEELFVLANNGDYFALDMLIDKFKPCLIKNSIINGIFDEDCFQELNIKLINCIYNFTFNPNNIDFLSYLNGK